MCFRGQTEPEFFRVEQGGLTAVVMRVPAAAGRPVVYAGERWMRVHSAKVRLREFPEQERDLLQRLARASFEQGVAAEGCTAEQVLRLLDTAAFFRACGEPVPQGADETLPKLAHWGCVTQRIDGRWNVLNLGALLLARDLNQFGLSTSSNMLPMTSR